VAEWGEAGDVQRSGLKIVKCMGVYLWMSGLKMRIFTRHSRFIVNKLYSGQSCSFCFPQSHL